MITTKTTTAIPISTLIDKDNIDIDIIFGPNNEYKIIDSPITGTINMKSSVKHEAKAQIKTKFIIGHTYKLMDVKKNKYFIPRLFKCVKFIYSIKNVPVNIVIMKALDNRSTQKFSLNQTECLKFHIKYEPGLEVYSMSLNWKDITKNKK